MTERRPHRLRRRPATELMLFAGRSNPALASAIARRLGVELGDVDLETFGNGEMYCRYGESIRGADVFIVQSGSPPVNDHILELLVMINAARLASAHRITAVMPLFPYARQDKKSAAREPISARMLADMVQAAGADRVLTMDLHAGQIVGFFGVPVDHMTALPLFARHYRRRLRGKDVVVVSPDLGRVKAARRFALMLGAGFAIVMKVRPAHEQAVAAEVIGDVRDKHVVMGDDMIVSGGTLASAAAALLQAGARDVRAFATHALFTPEAPAILAGAGLADIAVTDTVVPDAMPLPPGVEVVSVAGLLGDTIRAVFEYASVSAIFAGENELF